MNVTDEEKVDKDGDGTSRLFLDDFQEEHKDF